MVLSIVGFILDRPYAIWTIFSVPNKVYHDVYLLWLMQMVIVGDDCALPPPPRGPVGRRGLAGTLFAHKVESLLDDIKFLLCWVSFLILLPCFWKWSSKYLTCGAQFY